MNNISKFIKQFYQKTRPFRITRNLVLTIFFLSILTLTFITMQFIKVKDTISIAIVNQHTDNVKNKMSSIIRPVYDKLFLTEKWLDSGLISIDNHQSLIRSLLPVLQINPMLYGISLADQTGREYSVYRTNNNGFAVFSRSQDGSSEDYVLDKQQKTGEIRQKRFFRDPRTSKWYKKAVTDRDSQITWTEEQLFPQSGESVIHLSAAVKNVDQQPQTVITYTIRTKDVHHLQEQFLEEDQLSIFFIENTLPSTAAPGQNVIQQQLRSQSSTFNNAEPQVIQAAISTWRQNGSITDKPFKVRKKNTLWWSEITHLPLIRQHFIGIIIPEFTIIEIIEQRRSSFLIIILSTLLLMVLMIVLLVRIYRRFGHPGELHELTEDKIAALIKQGESDVLEFKRTMRMNLKSGKPGKEMEIAWLKTITAFLNSEGGTLIIGIADNGQVFGIKADGFANDDKFLLHFSNLIKEYIGLEFAKNLDFAILPYAGQHIFMVNCTPTKEPVFLKSGSNESFYIRNGPASLQLPISKALKYINARTRES